MMTKVCKDCQERYPACWGSCEKFLAAKEKHLQQSRAAAQDRHRNNIIKSVQYHGLKRHKK